MSSRRIRLRGWIAAAALATSGAFAALAGTPVREEWTADPEEQFLLDVNIRQFRLGDGVRAYNTPTGTCVLFGDFVATLDLPIKVDLATKTASGWAFKESNQLLIDAAAGKVSYGGRTEALGPYEVRETPEGWCVDTAAMARWFGISIKPLTSSSALLLESEAKLPVEQALERQKRAETLMRKAKLDLTGLPQVKLPYRMWRPPALDFVVNAGVAYRAKDGTRVDRSTSVFAAGEIAQFSYDAQIGTNHRGRPDRLRLRAYRSDPGSGLLGPLKATHFGVGDVEGFDSRLSGSAESGRGALITNRPLFRPTAFGRTRFEGDLPAGWEAEIYRNNELIAFTKPTSDQKYVFDNVELQYGDNEVRVVLYGPQGQVRTREETLNVGQDNVPAGKTWYWAGFNQPGRDVISLVEERQTGVRPQAQATVAVEHGLDERTSVGALARTMLLADERLTFVEGTIRRSVGTIAAELSASHDSSGGRAVGFQMVGKVGAVNLRAEALAAKDFHCRGTTEQTMRDVRLAADVPLKLGRAIVPVRGSLRLTRFANGSRQIEASGRVSTSLDRFNIATDLSYRKQTLSLGQAPPGELDWSLIGSGRVGNVRLRGASTFRLLPERKLRTVELSGYLMGDEKADWEGGLIYDAERRRGNARVSHIRRMSSMAVAVTAEAASDKSVALGLSVNFSLDPMSMTLSRQPLAGAGAVRARVFRDLNDNGVRDADEPLQKGALVTTGTRLSDRRTGSDGAVTIGGLTPFQPVVVGLDTTTLNDPSLATRSAVQMVVPRPGVAAEVEIALVGAGAIEGALLKSGEIGFEGLDLELVDASGKVVAVTRTDFDGFFLFDRAPYGKYRIRIAKDSAEAARVSQAVVPEVVVTADKSVIRLGAMPVSPLPQIAAAGP